MKREIIALKIDGIDWLEKLVERGDVEQDVAAKIPESVTAGVLLAVRDNQIDREKAIEILNFTASLQA